MKRFFIEDVKRGMSDSGAVDVAIVASLKINDGVKTKWLSISEIIGITNAFLTDDDIFNSLLGENPDDRFIEYANAHSIKSYEGIAIEDGCYGSYYDIERHPDNPAGPVVKYLISLVRCDTKDAEMIIALGKGKYADEINIPISDVEQDYIDDNEEHDEEDKMIIKGLRWGTDGEHFACGPIGGSVYAEIGVVHNDKVFFVLVSRYNEFEKVEIAKHSLIDQIIYAMSSTGDVDCQSEINDISKNSLETYDYEIGDEPAEMSDSVFSKVIQLCRLAVNDCPTDKDNYSNGKDAYRFIEGYLDKNVDEINLPKLQYNWLNDDDDFECED